MMARWRARLVGFVLALLVATLSGTVLQTQFNLAALTALGAEIRLTTRLTTTLHDLLGFAPVYAGLVAAAFAVALPLAAFGRRWLPLPAGLAYAMAAALGVWLAFMVVDAMAPMPTLIAATRSLAGTLAMLAGAALGGLVFAHFVERRP